MWADAHKATVKALANDWPVNVPKPTEIV